MTGQEQLVRDLAALRLRIDDLNLEILALVEERGRFVLAIGELKAALGVEDRDPRREEQMLRTLAGAAGGPFAPAELREIFGALFRASLMLQQRSRRRSRCSATVAR